jgi:hypothetical protein
MPKSRKPPKRQLVVHCHKAPYDVYVGRPSKWGNPFTIGEDTRREVIKKYERWLRNNKVLMSQIGELKGKVLGCWCYPQACHADVLVRIANAT